MNYPNGYYVESSLAEFRHLYRKKCRFRILFIEPVYGCRFPTKSKSRRSPLMKPRPHRLTKRRSHCHLNQVWQRKFMQWRQRNLPKKVLHFQSFCFANFFIPVVVVIALSLLVVLPRKTILGMRQFCVKNRRFDGKRATKYPYRGSLSGDFRDNRFFFFSFYLEHHTSKLSLFSLENLAFLRGYM